MENAFRPANILLYNGADKTAFAVVACDQYTSEPEYWARTERAVGEKPSAVRLIFPETRLKTADFDQTIASINAAMRDYLNRGLFDETGNTFVYVERTLRDGRVRRGLVGKVDLEQYDYAPGSRSPVRATENTVLDRLPPRVKIRQNAPLELPHVMLLIDDPQKTVLEPLAARKATLSPAYSFPLIEQSGRLDGWLLPPAECARVLAALDALAAPEACAARYGAAGGRAFPYAVGDGNHSLAAARKCYQNLKEQIGETAARRHPARYALAELVNLHDDSLAFEAIHRVLFGVEPAAVLAALGEHFELSESPSAKGQPIAAVLQGRERPLTLTNPSRNLAVGSLQEFLDGYLQSHPGELDYIHGADVVKSLSLRKGSLGFLLPPMKKDELFPTVILDGALPRKTFSMGEACDKRFYFEARRLDGAQ